MKYRPGDKVRIKPYCEINEKYTGLIFLATMMPLCGMTLTLADNASSNVWKIKDTRWLWHENWFEAPGTFFSDEDFEI